MDWTRAVAYLKRDLQRADVAVDLVLSAEDSPVLKNPGNGLLVAYVVDQGSSFGYLQNHHLRAAGIDEHKLHATAIDNLYALAEKHLRVQQYGPTFAVFMEGNFEASVLLLDTVWDISFAPYILGEFVAAVPTRDVLAFGDSSSPAAITELRGVVDRLTKGAHDHPVSTSLYLRRNRVWLPYDS